MKIRRIRTVSNVLKVHRYLSTPYQSLTFTLFISFSRHRIQNFYPLEQILLRNAFTFFEKHLSFPSNPHDSCVDGVPSSACRIEKKIVEKSSTEQYNMFDTPRTPIFQI